MPCSPSQEMVAREVRVKRPSDHTCSERLIMLSKLLDLQKLVYLSQQAEGCSVWAASQEPGAGHLLRVWKQPRALGAPMRERAR